MTKSDPIEVYVGVCRTLMFLGALAMIYALIIGLVQVAFGNHAAAQTAAEYVIGGCLTVLIAGHCIPAEEVEEDP